MWCVSSARMKVRSCCPVQCDPDVTSQQMVYLSREVSLLTCQIP